VNGFVAGAAVLAIPAVFLATAATQTSVLVVDVTVDEGPRIVAPVPYALARAGTRPGTPGRSTARGTRAGPVRG
jgi:hypothetical protein